MNLSDPRGIPSLPRVLAYAGVVLLAACDAGGRAKTIGGGGGGAPGGTPLAVDFMLCRDVALGPPFIADAIARDLDGDGLAEIVTASFQTQTVTIARGAPDGSFATTAEFPTIGAAWRLAIGDVDGNGLADVVVACGDYGGAFGTTGVQVVLQGPAGVFSAGPSLATSVAVLDVALVPKDGLSGSLAAQDLLLALRDDKVVARATYDGGLSITATLESSSLGEIGGPYSVAVLDVGGDGVLDLAVGEEDVESVDTDAPGGSSDRVLVYPGDGAGGFAAPYVAFLPVYRPIVRNAGDVDGNGFDDLAVAQVLFDSAFLLAGDGSGLSQAIEIGFDGSNSSLLFEDIDGDGLKDVVGTVLEKHVALVALASAPLAWGEPVLYMTGYFPRAIGVIPLPGDSDPDLLCANLFDVSLLLGLGEGRFRSARAFPSEIGGPVLVVTGDLDNDGIPDAVALADRSQEIAFMKGLGGGRLETVITFPLVPSSEETPSSVRVADVDDDGDADVLVTIIERDEVRLFRNPGSIEGFVEPPPADRIQVGDGPGGVEVADLDGDGAPDLVVSNFHDQTVQGFLNAGDGSFAALTPVAVGFDPTVLRCMDLDNDGNVDVVCAAGHEVIGNGVPAMIVLAGDGNGGLSLVGSYALDVTNPSFDLGDLDDDGLVDVLVGQTDVAIDEVFVLWNMGGLAFESTRVAVTTNPSTVAIADADEDGALDLIVASGSGELKIAFGDGARGFAQIEPALDGELTVPQDTLSLALSDMDGDDLADLVFVTPLAPVVFVGLNASVEAVLVQ